MTEWNIQSRAHACEACSRGFHDQENYHTLLFDERAAFRRLDVCDACWHKQFSEGARDRKGFVSYWHGTFEAPPPPTDPIQKETAESLLRKIIELNDPQYAAAAYILAVMLERKRLLKVKEQLFREGRRLFLYEQPRTGDLFTIADPNLQLDQLETVQHQVAGLLEHGFNPPDAGAASIVVPSANPNTLTEPEGTPAASSEGAGSPAAANPLVTS